MLKYVRIVRKSARTRSINKDRSSHLNKFLRILFMRMQKKIVYLGSIYSDKSVLVAFIEMQKFQYNFIAVTHDVILNFFVR